MFSPKNHHPPAMANTVCVKMLCDNHQTRLAIHLCKICQDKDLEGALCFNCANMTIEYATCKKCIEAGEKFEANKEARSSEEDLSSSSTTFLVAKAGNVGQKCQKHPTKK